MSSWVHESMLCPKDSFVILFYPCILSAFSMFLQSWRGDVYLLFRGKHLTIIILGILTTYEILC